MHSSIFRLCQRLLIIAHLAAQPVDPAVKALSCLCGNKNDFRLGIEPVDTLHNSILVKIIKYAQCITLIDKYNIADRKHERIFERLIIALRDRKDHRVLCTSRIKLCRAHKIADIFQYDQIQITRAKLPDALTGHIRIQMAHTAGMKLNALYAIHKYKEIKAGKLPKRPITLIFGAKAAPAYIIAKDIIHLILCLQKLIEKDKDVAPYLKVVMVENYNVTMAEKLIPACDISEQISLASKEASGTGNMKFMLNGAVTLGTEDGANVEIHELVGDDNIYIFGEDSDTVIARYERGDYCSKDYYTTIKN